MEKDFVLLVLQYRLNLSPESGGKSLLVPQIHFIRIWASIRRFPISVGPKST